MNVESLRVYAGYYRNSKLKLLASGALSILRAGLLVPLPILVGRSIDTAIPERNTRQLLWIGAGILALTAVSAGVQIAARWVGASTTKAVLAQLRQDAIDRLLRVSRRYYSTIDTATLHDQVVNETNRIETGTKVVLDDYLPGSVLVIGITVVLVVMNPLLATVTMITLPVIYLATARLGRWLDGRIAITHRAFERFSHGVLAMLRSMDLVRIQSAESHESRRQAEAIAELQEVSARRAVGVTVYFVTQQALIAMAAAMVLIVGGLSVIRGSMTLGDLISFYAGFALLRGPLGSLAGNGPAVIEGARSMAHLHELLSQEDERPYQGERRVEFHGHVELDSVTFGYTDHPVIHDINLRLETGRVVGLVGPNGSGKSTIVNLIVGFYRPDRGSVRADGIFYDDIDMVELRREMGIVPQQPELRNATVWENIVYGRENVGEDDVWSALELAQGLEFVRSLPEGLHTQIGEEGVFLSGGQRQRVAIARALVHRPPLLILDEPTNHLDRTTVGRVVSNLRELNPRPAILVVSHRTEVLSGVDAVVEIEHGRIISNGEVSTPTRGVV